MLDAGTLGDLWCPQQCWFVHPAVGQNYSHEKKEHSEAQQKEKTELRASQILLETLRCAALQKNKKYTQYDN